MSTGLCDAGVPLDHLNQRRMFDSAIENGGAEAQKALRDATERKAFGRPIANCQLIQAMLADSETEVYAAECVMTDVAEDELAELWLEPMLWFHSWSAAGCEPSRTDNSLGHPIGATGIRILADMAHEMQRREVRYGLETMCIGGGQGMAPVFERAA